MVSRVITVEPLFDLVIFGEQGDRPAADPAGFVRVLFRADAPKNARVIGCSPYGEMDREAHSR